MVSTNLKNWAVAVGALALLPMQVEAEEWPRFRKGLWQFERTLELTAGGHRLDNRVLSKQEMRRCVDPSEAMRETFRPVSIGNCRPAHPIKTANTYVFALRCDYMGPVRTTIDVQSDSAYVEINELTVGEYPRTDTVVARRVAECD